MAKLIVIFLAVTAIFFLSVTVLAFLLGASECKNSLALSSTASCLKDAVINFAEQDAHE